MTMREAPCDAAALLRALFDAAVAAAHPEACLPMYLPSVPPRGRLVITGAGKAAAAMALVAERHYRTQRTLDRVTGFTTAPHGTLEALPGARPSAIRVVSARHPAPDAASQRAAEET